MVKNKLVAMKMDAFKKLELEKFAKEQGKTITEVLLGGLENAGKTHFLESKIKDMQEQITELITKYEKVTGKKAKTTRKITIPVTDQEFKAIHKAAFEAGLPKSQFVRKYLTNQKPIPALVLQ